jgi:hypothetical protein
MARWASLHPPLEVRELGAPDHVFRSHQVGPSLRWATYIFGTLSALVGAALLYVNVFTELVPDEAVVAVYALGTVFILGGLGMYGHLVWQWLQRTTFLYALYPEGLVLYQHGKWRLIPWRRVTAFEDRVEVPYLVLDGHLPLPLPHDFGRGSELYPAIARCVHDRDVRTGVVPRREPPPPIDFGAVLQLLAGFGLILGAAGVGAYASDWLVANLRPATPLSHTDLARPADARRFWNARIRFDCPPVLPTGVTPLKAHAGDPDTKLVLVPLRDRYLLAHVPADFAGGGPVTGETRAWRGENGPAASAHREALAQVLAACPQYRDNLLSYQFDATFQPSGNAPLLAAVLVAAVVVGFFCLVRGFLMARRGQTFP